MLNRIILALMPVVCGGSLAGGCASGGQESSLNPVTTAPPGISAATTSRNAPVSSGQIQKTTIAPNDLPSAFRMAAYDPGPDEYRIGPQDLLEIQVFGVDELNRTVRVNTGGYISLPLVGLIMAGGLTSEQLEQRLSSQLAKDYLQDPHVSVFIKEYTSQRVTVEGAVKKPGVYPIKGHTTLLQTLAAAEGLVSVADPSDVKVFTTDPDGSRKAITYDLDQIRLGKAVDPIVRGDDIIQVGESTTKAVAKDIIEFILPFGRLYYWW